MTAPDPRAWLDQVDARTNAATNGPWHALTTGRAGGDHWHVTDAGESLAYIHASDGEDEDRRQPDAEFIASARTDLPAATTALRAVLDLHRFVRARPGIHSGACSQCWCPYPCATVTAITTALEDA